MAMRHPNEFTVVTIDPKGERETLYSDPLPFDKAFAFAKKMVAAGNWVEIMQTLKKRGSTA